MFKDVFILKDKTIPGVCGTHRQLCKGDIVDLKSNEADRLIASGIARLATIEDVKEQKARIKKMMGGAPYNKARSLSISKKKKKKKKKTKTNNKRKSNESNVSKRAEDQCGAGSDSRHPG